MTKIRHIFTLVSLFFITSINVQAAEVCKVSMMGRICYEEGNELATAEHMKGDATKQNIAVESAKDGKKVVAK